MARHIFVTFSPRALLQAVAEAFAVAAGAPVDPERTARGDYPAIPGLSVDAIPNCPGLALMQFDHGTERLALRYDFEFGRDGARGVLLPYSARHLALAWAVVEQLGGCIRIDEDSLEQDLEVACQWPADPEDLDFDTLQQRVRGTRRVTDADIAIASARLMPA